MFDTNIYVSAIHFTTGIPRKLLDLAERGVFILIVSKRIMMELRGVLRTKFAYTPEKLDLEEELLLSLCETVESHHRIRRIKEDPDDNRILECALAGDADYIVSGDKHLLRLQSYKGISILLPAEFLARLQKESR